MHTLRQALSPIDALEPRPLIRWAERFRWPLLAFVLIVVGVNEVALWGSNVLRWDWMFVSGYLSLLIGIALATNVSSRMTQTLDRLVHRGALPLSSDRLPLLTQAIDVRARSWAHRGGILLGLIVLVAYLWVIRQPAPLLELPEMLAATVAAYVAGRMIGRMTAYGLLGSFLHEQGIALKVQPGHLDGAGGLKPVGDLFFFQAMLLAVPAGFLAVWLLLIPLWPYHDYTRWREPYLGLLAVGLVAEVAAFVLPMWTIHQDMKAQKADLLVTADELSHKILGLRARLAETADARERAEAKERLELMVHQYQEIEELATWPVDPATRRRFAVNNLMMVLPMVAQVVGATGPWQMLAQAVERFLAIR